MLNKEMLLIGAGKDVPHVIVTDSVMNRTPYWNAGGKGISISSIQYFCEKLECQTRIGADIAVKTPYNFHIEARCLENNTSTGDMLFEAHVAGDDLTAYREYEDVFGLEGNTRSFVFTPPPTGIYRRCQRCLLRGGGVNAGERSTTAFDEKERADAEHTQWLGRQHGDHVFSGWNLDEPGCVWFPFSRSQSPNLAFSRENYLRRRDMVRQGSLCSKCSYIRLRDGSRLLRRRPNQRCGDTLVVYPLKGGANA